MFVGLGGWSLLFSYWSCVLVCFGDAVTRYLVFGRSIIAFCSMFIMCSWVGYLVLGV